MTHCEFSKRHCWVWVLTYLYSTLSQKIQESLSDVNAEVLDVAERVADVQLKLDCKSRICQTFSSE